MENLNILRSVRFKTLSPEEEQQAQVADSWKVDDLEVPQQDVPFDPFVPVIVILRNHSARENTFINKIAREFPLPYKKMIYCAAQNMKINELKKSQKELPEMAWRLLRNRSLNQIIMKLRPCTNKKQNLAEERSMLVFGSAIKKLFIRREEPSKLMMQNGLDLITEMDQIRDNMSVAPYYQWKTNLFFEIYEHKILFPESTMLVNPYMLNCLPFVDDTCPILAKAIAELPINDIKKRYLELPLIDQARFLTLMDNQTVVKLAAILSIPQRKEMMSLLDMDRYEDLYQLDYSLPNTPLISEKAFRDVRAKEAKLAKKRRHKLRVVDEAKDDGMTFVENHPQPIEEMEAPQLLPFIVDARNETNRNELAKLNCSRGQNRRTCNSHITMWKNATHNSAMANPVFVHYHECTKEEFMLERAFHMTAEFFARIMAEHQATYAEMSTFEDRNGNIKPSFIFRNVKLAYQGREVIFEGSWRIGHEVDEVDQPRGKVYHSYPNRGRWLGLALDGEMQSNDGEASLDENLFQAVPGSLFITGEVGGELVGRLQLGQDEDDFMLITCLPL